MPTFKEVLPETGVPQDNFMVVPHEGENLVWIAGARGGSVSLSHDGRISVQQVSSSQIGKIADEYVLRHGANLADGTRKQLWASMLSILQYNPGNLFQVKGKTPGWSHIKATHRGKSITMDVAVTRRNWIDVAFRFVRHKTGSGTAADTQYTPDDAPRMIEALNWIYGPQVNVRFDLWDAEWVTLDQAPGQPVSGQMFLGKIAPARPSGPDVTVFLLGKWGGGASGHSNGTSFYDLESIVVTDDPSHLEIPQNIDPFNLTLAHELAHHLRYARGFTGHHDRPNVLLSNGIQSLRLDKQLVMDINPP